ncbi:GH14008 [Drosophila grimshawi]|uniref:GH14008 n=1 Tax=Drosophila grimshawi TaxID=7222 RepID=B4JYI5_DROGR|nr:GH14008 [Drosophila grimshawi]
MRLDGALEPRHGAATLQGRFIGVAKYRRETRVKCEQQQQQCADEDDEAAAEATAKDVNSSNSLSHSNSSSSSSSSNNCHWTALEQQARHLSPSQAPGTTITITPKTSKVNLHLSIEGATPTPHTATTATATTSTTGTAAAAATTSPKMREEQSLMLMGRRVSGSNYRMENMKNMGRHTNTNSVLCLISVAVAALLLPLPPLALADDGDNFFAVNSFSVGPETTTPEFAAAINESCFFNEQCEAIYFQTECRDGRCICRFEMSPIWGKDGSVECKGRQDKRGPETYIDPAMIGVLVGMALMFIIICVVLRLFSQARWHENRTIFNTPNPRLMNVSLLRDNKLLHGQDRRGSRMSVRAPSRQPSMASLRPHSPNPSLGSQSESHGSASNASATSVRSNRSNSVAPGKVSSGGGHHERHGSAHRQHHSHHLQSPQEESLITNITTNPVAESVTVEIIEPGQKDTKAMKVIT